MSVRIARRFVTIAGSALILAALVSGASVAVAATTGTTKVSLAAPTVRDVDVLVARENAVVAQLRAFQHLGKAAPVAQWEARLQATEAAQTTAEATLNADLASASSARSSTAGVLYQQSGSGTASTANFTAPTNWNIEWTYNCASFGYKGNFAVSISQAGTGSMASLGDVPINQLGMSGSGVQHYHYGGKLYLAVNSECDWTLKVVSA